MFLRNKKFKVLMLNENETSFSILLEAIFQFTDPSYELLICIKGESYNTNFLKMLSSIREVNYIIKSEKELKLILEDIQPLEIKSFN